MMTKNNYTLGLCSAIRGEDAEDMWAKGYCLYLYEDDGTATIYHEGLTLKEAYKIIHKEDE